MAVELHLPDLPEVPITIGAARPRRGMARWSVRLRSALSAYLPLLMMGMLALGSWWLVKNMPPPPKPRVVEAPRSDPDYTMTQFTLERFEPTGRLKARIEGAQMRHYPDADRIEIDTLQLRAFAPDGRITVAHARKAISNGDASEVQLIGGAQVEGVDAKGQPIVLTSEFLHLFMVTERVRTHLPVLVRQGGAELHAGGLQYDHASGRLELQGPQRAVLPPRAQRN